MIRCGSKNEYEKNMCSNEIVLGAQNMMIVLGSIVHIIGRDPFNLLMRTRIFTMIMNKIFI